MFVVGLTGGIGSGKSVVANTFASLGVPVIDADKVAHDLTKSGKPATKKIEEHFGNSIIQPDGSLDRAALRQQVFDKPVEREWLERLLHPLIRKEMENQISKLDAPYCIAVIPLLLEVEFYYFTNRILVVDAPEEAQIARAMTRDNLTREDVINVINVQAKRHHRITKAHDIIQNDRELKDILPQVEKLHHQYLQLASAQMD